MVVDASAVVDLLLGNLTGLQVARALEDAPLHAPAHLDAEVLSALARLSRAGSLAYGPAEAMLATIATAPITRHPVAPLLPGAWSSREQLRVLDGLYVELARQLGTTVLTTDRRLAAASPLAKLVSA